MHKKTLAKKKKFDRVNGPPNVNIKLDMHTPVYTPSHMHGTHMHGKLSHRLTHVPQNVYAHERKKAHLKKPCFVLVKLLSGWPADFFVKKCCVFIGFLNF